MKCDAALSQKFNLNNCRVLLIKPSSLGDIVHTVPMVHSLKRHFPGMHVSWVVQEAFSSVIAADEAIDEIIPINIPSTSEPGAGLWVFLTAGKAVINIYNELHSIFKNRPCDYVLDLHASLRGALLGMANPNGIRIGFSDAKELNSYFQDHLIYPDPAKPHAVDKNNAFAEFFGCSLIVDDFRLRVSDNALDSVDEFLKKVGATGKKVVYANPAGRWVTKFWIPEYWAQLADMLVADGVTLIFCGARQDQIHIDRVMSSMQYQAINAAGLFSLSEATALMARSNAYVGIDSGPMHIAAFTGTPCVAIFGPTDPIKVGPYGPEHIVLQNKNLDCLACRKRKCAVMECMKGIRPEDVYRAVQQVLTASN